MCIFCPKTAKKITIMKRKKKEKKKHCLFKKNQETFQKPCVIKEKAFNQLIKHFKQISAKFFLHLS